MKIDPSKIRLSHYQKQPPIKSLEEQAQQEYENHYVRLFNQASQHLLKTKSANSS